MPFEAQPKLFAAQFHIMSEYNWHEKSEKALYPETQKIIVVVKVGEAVKIPSLLSTPGEEK